MLRVQDPKLKGISGADGAIFLSRDSLAKITTKALRHLCLGAPCLCGCSFKVFWRLPNLKYPVSV